MLVQPTVCSLVLRVVGEVYMSWSVNCCLMCSSSLIIMWCSELEHINVVVSAMSVVKHHTGLHIILNAACCWSERRRGRGNEKTHSAAAEEGWIRRTTFTAPAQCGRLSSFCLQLTRLSWQPDLPFCQLWMKHLPHEQSRLAAPGSDHPWWSPH